MSRGALYHQFANKAALFLAVLEAVEEDITVETARAAGSTADPVEAAAEGRLAIGSCSIG